MSATSRASAAVKIKLFAGSASARRRIEVATLTAQRAAVYYTRPALTARPGCGLAPLPARRSRRTLAARTGFRPISP